MRCPSRVRIGRWTVVKASAARIGLWLSPHSGSQRPGPPVNGCGRRASHLRSSASICSAPSRSQIACTASASAQVAKPLVRAANPRPAFVAWR